MVSLIMNAMGGKIKPNPIYDFIDLMRFAVRIESHSIQNVEWWTKTIAEKTVDGEREKNKTKQN